jgi:UrcA family protein
MRDNLDARLWVDGHEAYSDNMATALAKAARRARRIGRAVPMPLKLRGAVLGASVLALSAPPPAFAGQVVDAPAASVAVPYGDLNLRSAAGRRALAGRVEAAARQLCQPGLIAPLKERADRRACFEAAVASAQTQIAQAAAPRPDGSRAVIVAVR